MGSFIGIMWGWLGELERKYDWGGRRERGEKSKDPEW